MTTARDVIAEVVGEFMSSADRAYRENMQCADMVLARLKSAPDPVRLELVRQLCPIMIAAFRQIIEINDEFRRTLPPDWEGDPLNDACQAAKKLLPTPPSEDKA